MASNGLDLHIVDSKVGFGGSVHLDEKGAHVAAHECAADLLPTRGGIRPDHDRLMDGIGEAELATVASDVRRQAILNVIRECGLDRKSVKMYRT